MTKDDKKENTDLDSGFTIDTPFGKVELSIDQPGNVAKEQRNKRLIAYVDALKRVYDFKNVFAKNLKYYLDLNNMSQKEFASRMGVAPTTVTYWVKGDKTPQIGKLNTICEVLHVSRDDLLTDRSEVAQREINLLTNFRILEDEDKYFVEKILNLLLESDKYKGKLPNSEL